MKILLGVDTTPHASETVSMVGRMPWPRGTSIRVLSIVAPGEPQYVPPPHVLAAVAGNLAVIEAQELAVHEESITRTIECLRAAGLDAAGEIVYGDPRHVLSDSARAQGVDLIVVGIHAHTGLGRFTPGSVASYLVAHAPCNVLVVRRAIAEPAP